MYATGAGTVLRRYRTGGDTTREAALMRHLFAHGFPVPDVLEAAGADLVMSRLQGPVLLDALLEKHVGVAEGATLLASLHVALRRAPLPEAGRRGNGLSIVHLDLHPGNVILDRSRGPVLIDWANAEIAPGELDVAMSAILVAEVALAPAGSHVARSVGPLRSRLDEFLTVFVREVGADPRSHLAEAQRRRAADPALSPHGQSRVAAAARWVTRMTTAAP